ncbi:muscarinic acetylcholine receptor M3-like [Patiria miniata]|uniref:G-protein coupled receptors family 1 profile domain-containing protein n=1 Tax=Patiria miniata TaxID=46514 RepID=A0A914ATD7_PATMI|nr:muscarinic acetylcholine receptor M3-like [Patiria miniata]
MAEEVIVNVSAPYVSDDPVHPALLAGYIFVIFIAAATSLVYVWFIATVAMEHILHNVSNYFMASLCVSLIVIGILTLWWAVILMSNFKHSALKLAIASSAFFVGVFGYFLNSVVIAADRYLKISRPLQYLRLATPRRCTVLIGASWCLPLVLGLAAFLFAMLNLDTDSQESLSTFLQSEGFRIPLVVMSDLTIFPSMIAVTFLIAALVRIARQQRRKIRDEMLMLKHLQDRAQQTEQEGNDENAPQPRPNHSANKTTVYFIVHFSAFVVAWLPASVSMNFVDLSDLTSAVLNPLITANAIIAMFHTFCGTMFLAYAQPEHRQAARNNLKRVKRLICDH